MWLKYGLKAQKLLIATRPERAEAPSPGRVGQNRACGGKTFESSIKRIVYEQLFQ